MALLPLAPLLVLTFGPPKRPSYTFRAGERVRYAWRTQHHGRDGTATVIIEVVKVTRGGGADLRFQVTEPTDGSERPPQTISVDRWFYGTDRDAHYPTALDDLRLERPGTRKNGTYALTPGDGGASVYEVREPRPSTNRRSPGSWRRTVVLAPDGGWPLGGETSTTFGDGVVWSTSLTRLGP
ncbi:hypothetical protein EON77_02580 [bacterium]|nr:MAG: hypothetical protein EON77_02580 [bacterium]